MNGLWLINWHSVNQRFCTLLWLVAFALLIFIIAHGGNGAHLRHHYAGPLGK